MMTARAGTGMTVLPSDENNGSGGNIHEREDMPAPGNTHKDRDGRNTGCRISDPVPDVREN